MNNRDFRPEHHSVRSANFGSILFNKCVQSKSLSSKIIKQILFDVHEDSNEQECIPVGCVPPACLPYPSMHCTGGGCLPGGGVYLRGVVCPVGCLPRGCLPRGVSAGGVSAQGGVCLRGVCPGGVCGRHPLPVNRMTDRCINIALPQPRLRAAKINSKVG